MLLLQKQICTVAYMYRVFYDNRFTLKAPALNTNILAYLYIYIPMHIYKHLYTNIYVHKYLHTYTSFHNICSATPLAPWIFASMYNQHFKGHRVQYSNHNHFIPIAITTIMKIQQ